MRTTTWTAHLGGRRSPQKLRRPLSNTHDPAHWYDGALFARIVILVLVTLTILAIAWTFLARFSPQDLIATVVTGLFLTFGWRGVG